MITVRSCLLSAYTVGHPGVSKEAAAEAVDSALRRAREAHADFDSLQLPLWKSTLLFTPSLGTVEIDAAISTLLFLARSAPLFFDRSQLPWLPGFSLLGDLIGLDDSPVLVEPSAELSRTVIQ